MEDLLRKESASFSIEIDVELSKPVIDRVNRQISEMKRAIVKEDGSESASTSSSGPPPATVRERMLRYRLEVEALPRSGIFRITDEYLAALNSRGEVSKSRTPFLERRNNRIHLRMEGQAHPTYYERYLDYSILSTNLYAPHYPHMVAMREELSEWFFFYLEPRERMRAPSPVKETTSIGSMGENLASFLNTLQATRPDQFNAISKALHAIIPSIDSMRVDINRVGEAELKLSEAGKEMPASVISEGTLRIIGLLALHGAGNLPSLIGFEEPENGIHPRRIKLVADTLLDMSRDEGTTLVITTHSPLLLDVFKSENLYAVRKSHGVSDIKPIVESFGDLGRTSDVSKHLDDEDGFSVSQKVARGDFDAA
jgi:predicted ATPase